MNFLRPALLALLVLALTVLPACGDDGHHDHDSFDLDDACSHMDDPTTALEAPADMSAELPVIGRTHTRYTVSLDDNPDVENATLGHVDVSIAAEGRYALFFDRPVFVELFDGSGNQVEFVDDVTPVAGCSLISRFVIADLTPGLYTLLLAEAADGEVDVLLENATGYEPEGE